ncbi:Protein kinase-like (PK-like) [Glarea lozoyensis ATCC 20868]|uniref:Protein kinase-like (PK-like) n=1 Tax=Glarea lozoyensis (strain ATCC 20868 / MF5171) TaxID=1116229 RepID=S3DD02_GLAL2|nr:Protein kinase-like (PK-like) [Glarea lozoyensis ATCC 20868]EPE29866.1 Protein kinase-like (PK-like) [Glarea lozoyensis ATCC 20868]
MDNAHELNTSTSERLQAGFGSENETHAFSRDSAYYSYPPNIDPVLDTPTSNYPVLSDQTSANFSETSLAATTIPLYGADYGASRHSDQSGSYLEAQNESLTRSWEFGGTETQPTRTFYSQPVSSSTRHQSLGVLPSNTDFPFIPDATSQDPLSPRLIADDCVAVCYNKLNGRTPNREEIELCAALSYVPLKVMEDAFNRHQENKNLQTGITTSQSGRSATDFVENSVMNTLEIIPDEVQKAEASKYVQQLPAKCLRRNVTLPPPGTPAKPYKCPDCGNGLGSLDSYRRHLAARYPKEAWLCLLCSEVPMNKPGKISFRQTHFQEHYEKKHKGLPFREFLERGHFSVEARPRTMSESHCRVSHAERCHEENNTLSLLDMEQTSFPPEANPSTASGMAAALHHNEVATEPDIRATSQLVVNSPELSSTKPTPFSQHHTTTGLSNIPTPCHHTTSSDELLPRSSRDTEELAAGSSLALEPASTSTSAVLAALDETPASRLPKEQAVVLQSRDNEPVASNALWTPLLPACVSVSPLFRLSQVGLKLLSAARTIARTVLVASSVLRRSYRIVKAWKPKPPFMVNHKYLPSRQHRSARLDGVLSEIQEAAPLRKDFTLGTSIPLKVTSRPATLADKLFDCRVQTGIESNQHFIPVSSLDHCLSVKNIRQELGELESSMSAEAFSLLVHQIHTSTRRIFAILVIIERPKEIPHFITHGISDKCLPYIKPLQNNSSSRDGVSARSKLNILLQSWHPRDAEVFNQVQWTVLAPVFTPSYAHYTFLPEVILPFRKTGTDMRGGFSEVWKITIHPAHQTFFSKNMSHGQEPRLAVKQLLSSDRSSFDKEVEMLKSLNTSNHPHIMKLLATFRHKNKYHLVFPLAQGNLREYWKTHQFPDARPASEESMKWVLSQMKGLSEGLQTIHCFGNNKGGLGGTKVKYGRHGDLKPDNILWFSKENHKNEGARHSDGVLVLADFGLGQFHRRETRSRIRAESIGGSPTYEPPECALRKPVSRAYDVWSLGCLYLEFLTWILKGSNAIDKFADARGSANTSGINGDEFYAVLPTANGAFNRKAVVKHSVTRWIADLKAHPRCSDAIVALLLLVETQLLRADSAQRSNITQVVSSLNNIIERGKADPRYLCKDGRTISSFNLLQPIPAMGGVQDSVSSAYHKVKSPPNIERQILGRKTLESHHFNDSDKEVQNLSPSSGSDTSYLRKHGDESAVSPVDFQHLLSTQNKDITPTVVSDSHRSAKRTHESTDDDHTPYHDYKRAKWHATTKRSPVPAKSYRASKSAKKESKFATLGISRECPEKAKAWMTLPFTTEDSIFQNALSLRIENISGVELA